MAESGVFTPYYNTLQIQIGEQDGAILVELQATECGSVSRILQWEQAMDVGLALLAASRDARKAGSAS